jgi:hypothetical protein
MPKIFTKGLKVNIIEYGGAVATQPSLRRMVYALVNHLQKLLGL